MLSSATDGFSFAYIKELMLSSLMQWVSDGRDQPLHDVAARHVEALRAQMATSPTPTPEMEDPMAALYARMEAFMDL